MSTPNEIIRVKRDGGELTRGQIEAFVNGLVDGSFADYQATALLMAIVLRGMSSAETACLTEAMLRSGKVYELGGLERPKVDKHSTGGVGDKVSLILAPLAASAGLCVPMMSGRGLGHTGGTLDKLESIPGFSVDLDEDAFRAQLARIHQAMIGQSEDVVPADRILYALRDVTATVESIPLICSSILSKKMAEGIEALVLDVKCGSGAFMETEAEARELAESLVEIARRMGRKTSALITRMDEPLGNAVGNALEVDEVIACLKGEGPADLMEVTFALTAEMMRLGGLVESTGEALEILKAKVVDGSAMAAFRELIEAQGGDAGVVDDPKRLPGATIVDSVYANGEGYIGKMDARLIGEAAHRLGAGRNRAEDAVDPAVGIVVLKKTGDRVAESDVLFEIHANDPARIDSALDKLDDAFEIVSDPPARPALIMDRLIDDN